MDASARLVMWDGRHVRYPDGTVLTVSHSRCIVRVCVAVRVASVAVPLPPLRVRHEARRDETTCKKKNGKCVHPSEVRLLY